MGFRYIQKIRGYFLISIFMFLFVGVSISLAATVTSVGNGLWSSTATWDTGNVPTSADDVIIATGHTVTLDAGSHSVVSITINGVFAGAVGGETLNLTGNFTLNSTGSIDIANIALVFNGSSQQSILGTGSFTFNNLTLANAAGLALSANTTINAVLTLTSGVITTGSNNLTIEINGSISGASSSSYVSGRLAKIYGTGSQSFTYETGKGGDYLPLTLDITGLSTSGYTRGVEQFNSDPHGVDPTIDAGLAKISTVRYWNVFRLDTGQKFGFGAGIQITLSYNASDRVDASTTELDVAQLSTDVNGPAAAIGVWQSLGGDGTALTTGIIQSASFTSGGDYYTFGDATGGVDNSLPVELSAFQATPDFDHVGFSWTTSSELKNLGFNLYRRGSENKEWASVNANLIPGKGTYSAETKYSYTDNNVIAGHTYSYKLESVSYDGAVTVEKTIKVDVPVPQEYALYKNYPNPFNPMTHINFQVPEYSTVSIVIYDINGREVKTLINEAGYGAGKYDVTWNATDNFENKVASGMYFYRFSAGSFTKMGRLILLK